LVAPSPSIHGSSKPLAPPQLAPLTALAWRQLRGWLARVAAPVAARQHEQLGAAARRAGKAPLAPISAPMPAEQVGRIFVEFEDAEAAAECARSMDGRFFDGRRVTASFYPRRRLALWSRVRRAKSKTRLLFCRRRLRGYRSSA
jgi:hypothetical protein